MTHEIEIPKVTPDGSIHLTINLVTIINNSHNNTLTNSSNTGNLGTGPVSGSSGSITMTTNSSPKDLAMLIEPFKKALLDTDFSLARRKRFES